MEIITLLISLLLGLGYMAFAPATVIRTPTDVTLESVAVQVATPEPDVPRSEIYTLLDYGAGIFSPEDWRASAEEQTERTTLTYRSNTDTALVYFEYLHYPELPAGFEMNDYIKDDYFDIIFKVFESWERVGACSADGLSLYEFSASLNKIDYDIRYWAEVAAPDRLLTVSMDFEQGRPEIDAYAAQLFPTLPKCADTSTDRGKPTG